MNLKIDRPAPKRDGLPWGERLLLLLLCLSLCALLIPPAAAGWTRRAEARVALRNAKNVKLACFVVAAEQRAKNRPFSDQAGPYGFAEGVEEQILLLAHAPGEVWLLRAGEDPYEVAELRYREFEYDADYDARAGWVVARRDLLIGSDTD